LIIIGSFLIFLKDNSYKKPFPTAASKSPVTAIHSKKIIKIIRQAEFLISEYVKLYEEN